MLEKSGPVPTGRLPPSSGLLPGTESDTQNVANAAGGRRKWHGRAGDRRPLSPMRHRAGICSRPKERRDKWVLKWVPSFPFSVLLRSLGASYLHAWLCKPAARSRSHTFASRHFWVSFEARKKIVLAIFTARCALTNENESSFGTGGLCSMGSVPLSPQVSIVLSEQSGLIRADAGPERRVDVWLIVRTATQRTGRTDFAPGQVPHGTRLRPADHNSPLPQ